MAFSVAKLKTNGQAASAAGEYAASAGDYKDMAEKYAGQVARTRGIQSHGPLLLNYLHVLLVAWH